MHLLGMILKSTGKRGVPQGGGISPLLSNVCLNEVDRMLERAKEVTRQGRWDAVQYARLPMTGWSWWTPTRGMSGFEGP